MDENCYVEPVTKKVEADKFQNVQVAFLKVSGMNCPNCANRVRNSLVLLDGVVDAIVDHMIGKAQVAYNPDITTSDNLIAAVVNAGGDGRHEYNAQRI